MDRYARPKRPHGPTRPAAAALFLAAVAMLLAAWPAAAGEPGDASKDLRPIEERRMLVLSGEDGPGGPVFLTKVMGGGFLGVELTPLTPELRTHFGVPDDRGVMVARVQEDSPAARAGLQVGDIVTEIDGTTVDAPWDLASKVRGHADGEQADLVVWRDGRSLDFQVTVEEREREQIDLGRVMEKRFIDEPEVLRIRPKVKMGDGPTLYFEPESVERLRDSLDKIDWTQFDGKALAERNRELEKRIDELEKRLQELEEALHKSDR